MQILITSNNNKNDKLHNLNVLRYYNVLGMRGTNLQMGMPNEVNPNYYYKTLTVT